MPHLATLSPLDRGALAAVRALTIHDDGSAWFRQQRAELRQWLHAVGSPWTLALLESL